MSRLIIIIVLLIAASGCDRVSAAFDVLVGAEPTPSAEAAQLQEMQMQIQQLQQQQGVEYASGFYRRDAPPELQPGQALPGEQQGAPQQLQVQAQAQPPAQQPAAQQRGERVEVYDKGLQMVRATVTVPHGWTLKQDIETDLSTLQATRFILDYASPQGQLIRAVNAAMYSPMSPHKSFAKAWRDAALHAIGNVENLQLSDPVPSKRLAETSSAVHARRKFPQYNMESLEATLAGTYQGHPVEGVLMIAHMKFDQSVGVASMVLIMAPKGLGEATVQEYFAIDKSQVVNPEFERRMDQQSKQNIARQQQQHNAWMQQSQAAHEARMRQNRANFDAHQARMKEQSAAFDRSNQAWLDNFRGSGGGGGGGTGYDSQAQFIDAIYERNSFATPEGNIVHNDIYKYNYTDGQGNFYGTDDPHFNAASLQGDWTAVDPLTP